MKNLDDNNLIWMDLEMTGLNLEKDEIIQIAAIVTDQDLNILDEKELSIYIHIDEEKIKKMDDFVLNMHTKNGVLRKCKKSLTTVSQAEETTIQYLSQFVKPYSSPLCGNSIYMDKMLIQKYLPLLNKFLHYRLIDVSTIKLLYRYWKEKEYSKIENSHEALSDIKESIEELKYYRKNFFRI